MKKIILSILNISALIFFISCGGTEISRSHFKSGVAGKKNLALVNISVNTKYDLSTTRRNLIAEYELILKQHGFKLTDREIINKALTSLELPIDREYTKSEIGKIAEKAGADLIVQGFVSEASESLISDDNTINFHFKYYNGKTGEYIGETLYQYRGNETLLEPELTNKAIMKMLEPFNIKK